MTWRARFEAATSAGPGRVTTGAAVMAADKTGDIIHSEARGVTSVVPENAKAMTVETPLWIASCTKLLTTISALKNVEEGKLSLDADIGAILPEVSALEILLGFDEAGNPQYKKPTKIITLRYLLTQQAGMTYDFLDDNVKRWREAKGDHLIDWEWPIVDRCSTPLVYEPGEGWAYSVSIDWVGKAIERVNGGMRLGDYFKKHIYEPLGMTMTTFRPLEHEAVLAQLSDTTERTDSREFIPADSYFRAANKDPLDDLGGGGLYCTPADYLKVLISLLMNDEKLLKKNSVAMMFSPQLSNPKYLLEATRDPKLGLMVRAGVESEAWQYGFGGTVHTEDVPGLCRKGTLSWQGLPNCYWWIDPQSGTCGLYMSQLIPAGDPQSMQLAIDFRKEIFSRCN